MSSSIQTHNILTSSYSSFSHSISYLFLTLLILLESFIFALNCKLLLLVIILFKLVFNNQCNVFNYLFTNL